MLVLLKMVKRLLPSILASQLSSFSSNQCGQPSEQTRMPLLRLVVPDRHRQRLPLPDQHDQLLAPCDSCVDQVALEQEIMLRGQRDHDRRELRSLRLVDRDGVGQRNLIEFPEVVNHFSLVEAHRDLTLDRIEIGRAHV